MWFKKRKARPTAEDAARRMVILKHIVAYAVMAPPVEMMEAMLAESDATECKKMEAEAEKRCQAFWRFFDATGLRKYTSPWEHKFIQTTFVNMMAQQQIDGFWRVEACQTLMWALGLLPELPPYDVQADHEVIKPIPSDGIAEYVASLELRDQAEIDQARDVAESWHWRSRTRQLVEEGYPLNLPDKMKAAGLHTFDDIIRMSAQDRAEEGLIPPCIDDDYPAMGKAYRDLTGEEWSQVRSTTAERHFALNWLCGYAPGNRWDETPTGT